MIRLYDNRFNEYAAKFKLNEDNYFACGDVVIRKNPADVWDILSKYNGKTSADLKKLSNGNVITFGKEKKENDETMSFYTVSNVFFQSGNNQYPAAFSLSTSNLMGSLRLYHPHNDTFLQMEIHSRFDQNGSQLFLNYLLSKVYQIDFIDLNSAGREQLWEVITAIMLMQKLKEAIPVGLYKEYKQFEKNDLNFRGRLDLQRHLRYNYPLGGKIAYSYRAITFDNSLNHLLRCALEIICKKWPELIAADTDMRDFAAVLKNATPSWSPNLLHDILRMEVCRETVRHPFFAEYYETPRLLSKMLLEGEGLSVYDSADDEVSGIIFDGAWLWEEYISTILVPGGYLHAIYKQSGAIRLFEKTGEVGQDWIYPDFYSKERKIVLDTKYKKDIEKREDIFQLLSYTFIIGAEKCGLIYPPHEGDPDKKFKKHESVEIAQQYYTAKKAFWQSFAFAPMPQNKDEFLKHMREQEKELYDLFTS